MTIVVIGAATFTGGVRAAVGHTCMAGVCHVTGVIVVVDATTLVVGV